MPAATPRQATRSLAMNNSGGSEPRTPGQQVKDGRVRIALLLMAVAWGCADARCSLAGDSVARQDLPEWIKNVPGIKQPGMINGVVPPGSPTATISSELMMSYISPGLEQNQSLVYRDVRAPGTRSPIHVHRWGGITCVVKGLAEVYVEGAAQSPLTAGPGMCYMMPAMTKVSALIPTTEKEPAILQDIFVIACGQPPILFVEPGHLDAGEHELAEVSCDSENYMEPYTSKP